MSITASTITQATAALDRLLADVKAKIGIFLQNQQKIQDAKYRAQAMTKNATTRETAAALVSKADALLKIQADAEMQAQTLLSKMAALKTKVERDPLYSFLKTSMLYWGTRQFELIGGIIRDVTDYGTEGAGLAARMLAQNKDVSNLVSEVRQTEAAATGTGFLPRVSMLIQSTIGSTAAAIAEPLKIPLAVGAVAVAGFYFFPRIMKGLARR